MLNESIFLDNELVLQECDIKLMPGNLYCMQGQSLYCQSHYDGDGSVPLLHDPQPRSDLRDEGEILIKPKTKKNMC